MTAKQPKKVSLFYRLIKWTVRKIYPVTTVVGVENLPSESCIVVGNHAQMNGPICCELYFPRKRQTWCAAQMMHLREVPAYAFEDFWRDKPRRSRWFFKILSYLIAPLSVVIFNNAECIGVYHDARVARTFKQTVTALQAGEDVVIFPECREPHNHIVQTFQQRFVDVARLYYKRTGKALCFVPMYIAPALKQIHLGQPVCFNPEAPIDEERQRICEQLMKQITDIACSLPKHTVVPYGNIPKSQYPCNLVQKEASHETTGY